MANLLQISSICNRSGVPVLNQPQMIYVLTEISPGTDTAKTWMPLNFALVLDHSGSMAGKKLRTMKEAVKNIIEQLNPDDTISIVTFETKTRVLVPSQRATKVDELKRQVDKIEDAGGTNMAAGLREGINQVKQGVEPGRTNRLILLTDGEATDREGDSLDEADQAGLSGFPIIGLGFGKDWNEDFILNITNRSMSGQPGLQSGMVEYIPSPDEAVSIFQQVYQAIQVVAQDVTLTTRMVQGMEARQVWQVVPMIKEIGSGVIQGRAMVIPVGELESGGAAFLAEIMLPPRPEGVVRIAQSDVTFMIPGDEQKREAVDVIVQFTNDPVIADQYNERVMNVVEKVQAFKLQTQALNEAEMGDINGATRKLRQAVTILLTQGETDLADQMQQEANRLEQSGQISSEGKKTIKLTSRKTVKLSDD